MTSKKEVSKSNDTTLAKGWFDNTSVTLIDGDKFNNDKPWLLTDKRCSFVMFFADWCGHCQNLKPEYIKFANKAQFIHVYAIDSVANENLLSRINENSKSPFSVKGFPTIIIYCNGKYHSEYNDAHDWQTLLKTAMQVCKKNCKCNK